MSEKSTDQITVSVCMLTYNHEDYIADALDSILMQKVDFNYEIVVGEDCSTDNTRRILLSYASEYPAKFKLLLHKTNIGVMANDIQTHNACSGKYIAVLEADDYWIDIHKLQKQVDFLSDNEDVILLFSNAMIYFYNDDLTVSNTFKFNDTLETGYIHPREILRNWIIPVATTMYKNIDTSEFITVERDFPVGDTPFFLYIAQFGNIYYINEHSAVYRRLPTGITRSFANCRSIDKHERFIKYYNVLDKYFKEFDLSEISRELISARYLAIMKLSFKQKKFSKFFQYTRKLLAYNLPYLFRYFYAVLSKER